MATFDRHTCEQCGREYAAHPSARAAKNGFCSPRCETRGTGLSA